MHDPRNVFLHYTSIPTYSILMGTDFRSSQIVNRTPQKLIIWIVQKSTLYYIDFHALLKNAVNNLMSEKITPLF